MAKGAKPKCWRQRCRKCGELKKGHVCAKQLNQAYQSGTSTSTVSLPLYEDVGHNMETMMKTRDRIEQIGTQMVEQKEAELATVSNKLKRKQEERATLTGTLSTQQQPCPTLTLTRTSSATGLQSPQAAFLYLMRVVGKAYIEKAKQFGASSNYTLLPANAYNRATETSGLATSSMDIMLGESPVEHMTADMDFLLSAFDLEEFTAPSTPTLNQVLSEIGNLFASLAPYKNIRYDPNKSKLCIRPNYLKTVLTHVKSLGYYSARLFAHGKQNGQYKELLQDIHGFDLAFASRYSYKGKAFYVSQDGQIALDFHNRSGCSQPDGPLGTMLLGLVFTPKGSQKTWPGARILPYNMVDASHYAHTQFPNNAIAIYDGLLCFILGLVIPEDDNK